MILEWTQVPAAGTGLTLCAGATWKIRREIAARRLLQTVSCPAARTVGIRRRLRRRLRPGDVVEVKLLALQMDVEPVDDVLQTLHAVPGAARARQLVRLAGEADHDDGAPQVLQRAEHLFAAGGRRRAVVRLPLDEHERRLDVRDVAERRPRAEIVGLLPGRALEPGRLEQREIRGVPPRGPVGDGALRNGRGAPVAVPDQPGGPDAPAASAGDAELVLIDVAAPDEIVH